MGTGVRAFLDHPTPIAIAHRGGAEELPENTIPAFDAAVRARLPPPRDRRPSQQRRRGVLVPRPRARARHRPARPALRRQRRRDRRRRRGLPLQPRRRHSFPLRGTGIRVPTMEEVLTRWPGVFVNIDTKSDAVVEPLVDLLRRLDAFDRVCIGSFSDERLRRVRRLSDGAICTSMGPGRDHRRVAGVPHRAHAPAAGRLRPGAGARASPGGGRPPLRRAPPRERGCRCTCGPSTTLPRWPRLLDLGVDAIMTDRPRLLREVLMARGQWHGAALASA